jgi:hypothetical protein
MAVSKWSFVALFTLCGAVFAEIYVQCQNLNKALSAREQSIKLYEKAFIHSMNRQWQLAKEASDCSLKIQHLDKWKIEAKDLL